MSTVEKLCIQGIRSFGPNAEDCQSINFSSPVTLILGENGSGKTTIIECLKYALTGDAPPSSERGKSFVHDPKIFSLNEALGQIKLMVRNKCGERLSVCRSMKVFNRRGKTLFETLESTISFLGDRETKPNSISSRCADVDVAMCEFMGVSKAIINNVLFCHQEDSSWPLDESKKLKEKFDAIFGITEYNKAMEKIKKMRKEEMDALKVMDANLKLLVHLKQEMEDKSLSLTKAEQKCNFIKEQCSKCDEDMKPVDARLASIRKIEYEVGNYQAQLVEIETKKKNYIEQIESLNRKIKKKYEYSINELEMEIKKFSQKMLDNKMDQTKIAIDLNKLKTEKKGIQETVADIDRRKCVIQQQSDTKKECKEKRDPQIKYLCDQLNIQLKKESLRTPEIVAEVLDNIKCVISSKQGEITELKAQIDAEDQNYQMEIDTLRVEVTKSEEAISGLQKQKNSYEKESDTLESKLGQLEKSEHELKILTKQIEETDDLYKKSLACFDQEACRENIISNKNHICELQDKFKEIDNRLTFHNSLAKKMTEISLKEIELTKREQEVRRIKGKHKDNFGKVFSERVTGNYRRSLQMVCEKLRRNIKDLNDKANGQKLNEQSQQIKRKNIKDEISRMEKELEESNETVYQKCHSTPYEDLLARCKVAVTKYQVDLGALKSAEAMYNKYIQKIREEPCCPLCHKNMSCNETSDLTSELLDEIEKVPENIRQIETSLKAEQSKYENLLQLKRTIEKIQSLERDIPLRKDELKKIQSELTAASDEYETLQMLMAEPTINLDLVNSMLGDMTLLDEAIKESARIQKDLENLKQTLPDDHNSNLSIEDLQTEKSDILSRLEEERKILEINQQIYEKQMEGLNRLREVKNKLKDQQIQLQQGVCSIPQLTERQKELTKFLVSTIANINSLQANLQPLKRKLNAAIMEKNKQKEAKQEKLGELQSKYDRYKISEQDILRLNNDIMEYEILNLEVELVKLNTSTNKQKEILEKLSEEINKKTLKLDEIKTEYINQNLLERDLMDNLELKHLHQKEMDLNTQWVALKKELGNLDFCNVSKEKSDLIQKRDKATVRKGELLGQIGEINNQIMKLKRETEEPKYKESSRNYRSANYETIVTRRIVDDLGQHCIALEWSLIQFHAEKMEKINSLIREYWRLIYRGNDIDYIQIKTDEINADSSADRKRSYNYRVVQSKNNSEIEMRGRSSAGQRVLASLIIRMALAETFSSNCGVLALDEPTTNLDRLNIVSLCDALNRIVEERQTQSNFMLIIITHDEEFISALGKITSYHQVFRNDECKSVIRYYKVA